MVKITNSGFKQHYILILNFVTSYVNLGKFLGFLSLRFFK